MFKLSHLPNLLAALAAALLLSACASQGQPRDSGALPDASEYPGAGSYGRASTGTRDRRTPAARTRTVIKPDVDAVPGAPLVEVKPVDLTVPRDDLWDRIRAGFGMANLDNPLVLEHQAWYLNRPDYLRRMLDRARRYLFHIVEEIERRGLPTELALLPMVESAFNPEALSPAQASGLWQFIPSTGRNYGLEQNFWRDDRRDVVASTNAALEYLQRIYEMHGDWHLALASYNWGEGAVGRAVMRNQAAGLPTDYGSLSMPGETRHYVPKLQALKNIIANPELFGVTLDPVPNKPYFALVSEAPSMNMAQAARLAEVPLSEIKALNPQHKRPVIRSSGENGAQLVIPAEKLDTFLSNLQGGPAPTSSAWETYTLKRGDTLERVARRYGTTVLKLREYNNLSPYTKIGPGNTILVPDTDDIAAAGDSAEELPKLNADAPSYARKRGTSGRVSMTLGTPRRSGTTQSAAGSSTPSGAKPIHKPVAKPAARSKKPSATKKTKR